MRGGVILNSDTKEISPQEGELDTHPANRQIKDGIFKLLFERPENAAELYYALTGVKCSPDEIQIITITTTISGSLKNDLAFVVRGKALVIGEHQSTTNENMPVRILMYLGQLYEKWLKMKGEDKFLYSTKLHKIPRPEFVVFYNGTTPKPEKETLILSSAFEDDGRGDTGRLGLVELEVPVYNINKGMSSELTSRSITLRQYSEFVAKLREFQQLYEDFERAVKETVTHCIADDILADFLREMGGKIVSILSTEYNVEVAKRVYAEEKVEDIAKKMLQEGEPIEKVVRYTRLSKEAVKRLLEQ